MNQSTLYFFGNDEGVLEQYAWYGGVKSDNQTHPVGEKKPNPFGLHDIYGNVREWVEDCYHDGFFGVPSDGSAWTSGNCSRRVVRGGSWLYGPRALRSSSREWFPFDSGNDDLGFRIGRTL
jgi:formylglycine-generating enzyme required for sulfatase activity